MLFDATAKRWPFGLQSAAIPLVFVLILATGSTSALAAAGIEDADFKQRGIEAFEAADYHAAIAFITRAIEDDPLDAELHYLHGFYLHYLCYDSVPLPGFSRTTSDEVLARLARAIEIDPEMGDARYLMGAEYGGRAREELRRSDLAGARDQLALAHEAGAFPDWLLEYARNTLESCGDGAILLLGGDADTNPVHYLQWVEGLRTDVTAIPAALLERPWFVEVLARGVEGLVPPVRIEWSLDQIQDMRPYKWKTTVVQLPVADEDPARIVAWEISSDLRRSDGRQLLGAGRAVFAEILRANRFVRPVHFSLAGPSLYREGLEDHLRLSGFTFRLDPEIRAGGVDLAPTRRILLDEDRYRDLPTVLHADMPRVSSLLHNYRVCFLKLAAEERRRGRDEAASAVLEAMQRCVPESVLPLPAGITTEARTGG